MAKYFSKFPKVYYKLTDSNGVDTITNIINRFALEKGLKENTSAYYNYVINESDTPEIIAAKAYDSPERHWVVLMMNDIVDPQFDWPLKTDALNQYINVKYSTAEYANTSNTGNTGLQYALSTIHSYYKTETITTASGTSTNTTIRIDKSVYDNLTASYGMSNTLSDNNVITIDVTKSSKTYYEYEIDQNETKRTIKLLKTEFVSALEEELENIFNEWSCSKSNHTI